MEEPSSQIHSEEEQYDNSHGRMRTFLRWIWDTAIMIGLAILIVWPIRAYVAQPFFVRGSSMMPAFQDGEYLIIDQLSYNIGLRAPSRGDVVVFRYPMDPSQHYIKRIIGMPMEKIAIHDGNVLITKHGHREPVVLSESYLPDPVRTIGALEVVLGEDEYFVMGDNRVHSSDSRVWGALQDSLIVGRAFFRAFPIARAGTVSEPLYGVLPPAATQVPEM